MSDVTANQVLPSSFRGEHSALTYEQEQRLTLALLQGCMPRLFVPGVLRLVGEMVQQSTWREHKG